MDHVKFMANVIEIYGIYKPEILEDITMQYIKNRFKESELEQVLQKLILSKTTQYNRPPDPAEFEKIFAPNEIDLEREAQEWFDKLNRTGNSLDNIIVSNIKAHKALEAMGGWAEFCMRNPQYENLHRKKFVDAYIKATPEGVPRIQYGESSDKYKKPPLMYGDPAACRDALEYHKNPVLYDVAISRIKFI